MQITSAALDSYAARHGIEAKSNLTVTSDEAAALIAHRLRPRIAGKVVVEIGSGLGLLGLRMASLAQRVFCIEADPVWSSAIVEMFVKQKPKNLSFLFGSADEFSGVLKADIALFCTHSGVAAMTRAGALFAPVVVDVYGEMVEENPAAYDEWARKARLRA